MLHLYDTLSRN